MPRRRTRTLFTMGTNGTVLLVGLGTSVVSARALGPQGRGQYFALQALAAVVALVASLGVPQAIVTVGETDRRGVRLLIACHAALVAAAFLLVYVVLVHGLGVSLLQGWRAPAGAAAFAAASAASGDLMASAQLRAKMGYRFSAVRLLPLLAGLLASLGLILSSNRSARDWLAVVGAAQLVGLVAMLLTEPDRGRPEVGQLAGLVRECVRVYPAALLSQVTYKIDVLLVSLLLVSASVGYYSVASAAGSSVVSLGQAYGMLLFSDGHWSRRATLRRAGLALAGTALVAVPAALVAPWVIRAVYGTDFRNAERAAQVLILAAVPQAADYLLIHAHLLSRRLRRLYYVQLATAAFTTVGLLTVIGDDRLVAVAAISPISYAVSAALLALTLRESDQPATETEPLRAEVPS